MENIILLMLFTYPGAISYMVYYLTTHNKTYYQKLDTFSRSAWCFFLSAAVTVISFKVLSLQLGNSNLVCLIEKIKYTSALWNYLLLSFCFSIGLGAVWHFILLLHFKLHNAYRVHKNLSPFVKEQKVWQNLVQNYDLTDCAVIIRKAGKVVRAGMPEIIPGDIDKDRRIVLSYCEYVEQELLKHDRGLLGDRFVSVYDLATDTEIEFIASQELDKAILQNLEDKTTETTDGDITSFSEKKA